MDNVSPRLLWEIFKHLRRWLSNLDRAGKARKQESIRALREVVIASRETSVYLRQLQQNGLSDHHIERELARRWTQLGFELEDLGLNKLAKRCHISGKHWAEPDYFEPAFLEKADISLNAMEILAKQILITLKP
jgi:methanogenic corrinoid protein MtbC1